MDNSEPPASDAASDLASKVRRGRPPRARQETHEPDREPKGRAQRIPLGVQKLKLQAAKRSGFVRRWVNDNGARVQQALQGGYEYVKGPDGQNISQIVGSKDGGGPLHGFLMEIREDWYTEDQATKQEHVNATENQIRRGELVGKVGQDGVYVPKQGISIKRAG